MYQGLIRKDIKVKDYDDIIKTNKKLGEDRKYYLRLSRVIFNMKRDHVLDMFGFFLRDTSYLTLSSRLLNRLKKEKITNLEWKESPYEIILPEGYSSHEELMADLEAKGELPPKGIQEIRDAEMYVDLSMLDDNIHSIDNNRLEKLHQYFKDLTKLEQDLKAKESFYPTRLTMF